MPVISTRVIECRKILTPRLHHETPLRLSDCSLHVYQRYDPPTPQKITFGEMRASGVREILIYCRDHRCSHHVEISADGWAEHVRLSEIEPRFTCLVCGRRGAEVRPKFPPARMGNG